MYDSSGVLRKSLFQSTLSVRRATGGRRVTLQGGKFQSTLSVRRATPIVFSCDIWLLFQSTLSVRRATSCPTVFSASCQISIHALRKESDHDLHAMPKLLIGFQSTLSVRRATEYCFNSPHSSIFQSTLSVRRATYKQGDGDVKTDKFQSTLSVRRATRLTDCLPVGPLFQSTLSVRRATVQLDIFVHFLRRKPAAWL